MARSLWFVYSTIQGAMLGLGAGGNTPALHDSNYDFPDELIEIGSRYFIKIAKQAVKE